MTSRSSVELRHESLLGIRSSIVYESSRTSEESSYSGPDTRSRNSINTKKPPPIPLVAIPGKRRPAAESLSASPRYGAGGEGRQQMQGIWLLAGKMGSDSTNKTLSGRTYTIRREGFKKLPEEILLVILAELKKLHLRTGSLSCSTCWMRDVTNLGLSCKKWWGAARCALYEDIQIIGCDSILHTKKKFKLKYGSRLRLLRKTLRSRPELAGYVKCLKVPAMPDAAKSKKEQDEYLELLASLIMTCPNLERFPGFYPAYNHEFTKFVHALSTRTKLTEKVWVISASPLRRQHRYNISADAEYLSPILTPSPLLPEQCIDFFGHHSNWAYLKTLVLHCNPEGTIDSQLFTDIFYSLPSLENILVSSFPATSFNDETLLSLPSLKSIRLENLPGVTADGLSSYGSHARTDSLTSLSLISLPLLSLPVLTRLFSHLKSLVRFTISQVPSPSLPNGVEIYLHPYLASSTLQYLHWEFTNPSDSQATDILSKSMESGGFPALRTLRAPTDHDGTLQRLCRPRDRIEHPADRYRNTSLSNQPPHPPIAPSPPSTTRSILSMRRHSSSNSSSQVKSPTRSASPHNMDKASSSADNDNNNNNNNTPPPREAGTSLATARRLAQHRIEATVAATTSPKFHIVVWNEHGALVGRTTIGFLGTVESKVFYSLKADVEGSGEAIVGLDRGVAGLLDRGEDGIETGREGCTGSCWNLNGSVAWWPNGKLGRQRDVWWHTERGRWREVPLERFF
ncbi:hypothetical protein LZ554_004880 [Drepanopeziza brunnea f. sp. 'monogermtubi']|nr:hypothetical protein LZ554_004880 [Drepanopeziza brunnea f. sp. 'monogermtubi']